jgi:hypothetical protein
MVKSKDVDLVVDDGCSELAPILRSSLSDITDAAFSVVVNALPIECAIRITKAGCDSNRGCVVVVVLGAQAVQLVWNAGGWIDFLDACEAHESLTGTMMILIVGPAQVQAKLTGAAAAACTRPRPWSWCQSANVHEAAGRVAAIATYLSRGQDTKVREEGHCMRKQRKCEPTDFHAVYRSMLSEISGISTRQAANVMGAAPTMDRLLEVIETEAPDFPTLSKCIGFGEHRDVGLGVAKRIAEAVTAPFLAEVEVTSVHMGHVADIDPSTPVEVSTEVLPVVKAAPPMSANDDWWLSSL